MHRWFLLLLVLLLPLRGWIGEAMAGEMLQQALAGGHAAMATQAPADHAGDCAGHGKGPGGAEAAAHGVDPAGHDACPTCAACQACSAVALQPGAPLPLAAGFTQAAPRAGHRGHASAAPAPLLKPPIS